MSEITRRSFLEHTLFTAAAGLAAAKTALGADAPKSDSASTETRVAPTPKVKLAVIGLNGRGMAHLESFVGDDRVEIVALCDVYERTFAKAQQKLADNGRKAARTYQDIRKLLEDKDVQAVSIATPNHWHTLAGVWAMQAGRDVYVEKPVSHNVSEGRRLEQARVKYNRICQAGLQSRSTTACQQAVKYIRDGHIGKVLLARGLCYKRRPSIGHFADSTAPASLDYDIWLGPAPKRPFNKNRFLYNWHWNWDYGNGDIGNQGVHQMDIARWALGKTLPNSVIALGGRFGYQDDGVTPNTQLALFDYGDSKLLFEVRGLLSPGYMMVKDCGDIVYGTEGFVAFTADYGTAAAFDNQGKQIKTFHGGKNHFGNFISAVLSRQQSDLNCPVLEGHYSAALCHLANVSYRLGSQESFAARCPEVMEDVDLAEAYGRFAQHLADCAYFPSDPNENKKPKTNTPKRDNKAHNAAATQMAMADHHGANPHQDTAPQPAPNRKTPPQPQEDDGGAGKIARPDQPLKLEKMTYQLGPKLAFDPATETFGSNQKANQFLTREYREPFVVPERV